MNKFEKLCRLASDEHWCWNLACTTCGHALFRYAFAELASGKTPGKDDWVVHRRYRKRILNTLGSVPRNYSDEQRSRVLSICTEASLSKIQDSCKFPDWLGYLGLVLVRMSSDTEAYRRLSKNWASQLSSLVSEGSEIQIRLSEIAEGEDILNIKDLEACETEIMRMHTMAHFLQRP